MKINLFTITALSLSCYLLLFNCSKKKQNTATEIPNVVSKDIQKGIEKHIYDNYKQGKGFFKFKSGKKNYSFKLVRVHTEYLANLGPRSHFACVDMVDTKGDVYDIDFFLSGDPGKMNVTETTLHKLNGKPYYSWKQQSNGTWKRVQMKDATPELLGIIEGEDNFKFLYQAEIPEIRSSARMWIPMPQTDNYQTITEKKIDAPGKHRELTDKKYANKVLYFELDAGDSNKVVKISYRVKRIEKAAYKSKDKELARHMKKGGHVPFYSKFQSIAEKVVKNKKGDLVRARALYDHVIERMQYIKHGKGWGKGDALYACDFRSGNCTDFHAYFIAISSSIGIQARFAIGAAIPSSRNDGAINGYHCWVEFHADGKWWPVDISEADKYTSLATYYFGHHPANRLEFSRGRDLVVEPGPANGPINFLAYPVFETEGKQVKVKTKFSFKRL